MIKHVTTVSLLLMPWQLACGQRTEDSRASQTSAPAASVATKPDTPVTAAGAAAIDSQAIRFMPMMWMHLDSMSTWSPAQMQQMMAAHQQMAAQMMQMMGPGGMMGQPGMMGPGMKMSPGSPWAALRDSIQGDLSAMPGLSGKELAARRQAHIDRMRRMMVLGMGMMGAGGWATMPGGCGMLDSLGHMSAQQSQWMWTMHGRMSGQMMDAMMANMRGYGVAASPAWLALRDSLRADIALLPKLQGDTLRTRMLAHADRMHRLMAMQTQAMGMPMGPMGIGCRW
jgi:hypothetical protein